MATRTENRTDAGSAGSGRGSGRAAGDARRIGVAVIVVRVLLLAGTLLAALTLSVAAGGCSQAQAPSPPAAPGAPTPAATAAPPELPAVTPVPLGSGRIARGLPVASSSSGS